jgi:hypothetical protein
MLTSLTVGFRLAVQYVHLQLVPTGIHSFSYPRNTKSFCAKLTVDLNLTSIVDDDEHPTTT